MKNRIEQRFEEHLNYRDLPIHLHLGSSYQFSLPFSPGFVEGKGFFEDFDRNIHLALHLQFRDHLRGPKDQVVNNSHEYNSALGIGAEAWFLDFIALRMGIYKKAFRSGS